MRSPRLAAIALVAGQAGSPPVRELVQAPRPLAPQEVARVIEGARAAVAGKTCRLAYQPDGPGPDVLMGANGWPQLVSAKSGYTSVSGWVSNGTTPQRTETRVDLVTLT